MRLAQIIFEACHTNLVLTLVLQGERLSTEQMEICDHFVHIPQYGGPSCPAQSLITIVALTIVLQHFATWAAYPTRAFQDTNCRGKFVLDEVVHITGRTAAGDKVMEKRKLERAQADSEAEERSLELTASADY
jgi:hypothetical protein